MAAQDRGATTVTAGGASPLPEPEWKTLRYPDEDTLIRLLDEHPLLVYSDQVRGPVNFYALPTWVRLEWPNEGLWKRASLTKAGKMHWRDVQATYPERPGADEQDFDLVMRRWPDAFGEPLVEVTLVVPNITINDQHYSNGTHRVPVSVAADLRHTDQKARAEVLKAMMPKNHPDRKMILPWAN